MRELQRLYDFRAETGLNRDGNLRVVRIPIGSGPSGWYTWSYGLEPFVQLCAMPTSELMYWSFLYAQILHKWGMEGLDRVRMDAATMYVRSILETMSSPCSGEKLMPSERCLLLLTSMRFSVPLDLSLCEYQNHSVRAGNETWQPHAQTSNFRCVRYRPLDTHAISPGILLGNDTQLGRFIVCAV